MQVSTELIDDWHLEDLAAGEPHAGFKDKLMLFSQFVGSRDIGAWRSIWIFPSQNVARTFVAHQVEDEILLESRTREGRSERRIFSDITLEKFCWRAEDESDDSKKWILAEDMKMTKQVVGKN